MIKHHNIHITGDVQGVAFRWHSQLKASELGLTGYVQNQSDGSVYIEAEGEEEAIKEFIEWAQEGPDSANVAGVNVTETSELKHYQKFEIK